MFRAKERYSGMPYLNEWLFYQPGGAGDMTSPGAAASAAGLPFPTEAHQSVRCQWPNDPQDAHFHHARRFQASPLIPTYFKWPKADNAHDHGLGLGPPHDGLHPTNLTDHLHRSTSNNNINGGNSNNNNNHNDSSNNNNNNNGGGGGGGGSNGGGGGGGINYARTTSSGSLSGPPTPTGGLGPGSLGSGGPNTPLVVPQPVKPPGSRGGGVKTYQCKICDQVFSSKSDMLIHCQQIHKQDPKPYKCPTCSKSFAGSSCLSQHSRIHTGLKPYRCEICERKFTQLSHLQQHIRTHTGEKPYKCMHPGCGKAFSQLSNLQSHSRSHMTDRPFRCNSCYKCYADEQSLREHIPKHSDTKHLKTHICHICGKSYTQETYLSRHMAKHAAADTLPGKHSLMPGLGSPPSSASSRAIKQEPMDLADPRDAYHRLLSASTDPHRLLGGAGGGSHPIVPHPSNHHSVPNSQHHSPSDRSPPSDLSMNGGGSSGGTGLHGGSCSKGGGGTGGPGAASSGGGGPTSAFMPLSPFAANTVSSSGGPGYHYSPSLSHHHGAMNPSLPHISSMASPRYFPYDSIGPFGRKSSSSASPTGTSAMLGGLGDSALSGAGSAGVGGVGSGGAGDHRNLANMHSLLSLQQIKNFAASSQGQMPGFGPAGASLSLQHWTSTEALNTGINSGLFDIEPAQQRKRGREVI